MYPGIRCCKILRRRLQTHQRTIRGNTRPHRKAASHSQHHHLCIGLAGVLTLSKTMFRVWRETCSSGRQIAQVSSWPAERIYTENAPELPRTRVRCLITHTIVHGLLHGRSRSNQDHIFEFPIDSTHRIHHAFLPRHQIGFFLPITASDWPSGGGTMRSSADKKGTSLSNMRVCRSGMRSCPNSRPWIHHPSTPTPLK